MSLNILYPAASIGLNSLVIKPRRGFVPQDSSLIPISAQITISEIGHDELQITDHPVEVGSVISDHAFAMPTAVDIVCSWSNSSYNPSPLERAVGAVGGALGGLGAVIASASQTYNAVQSVMKGNSPNQVKAIYQKMIDLQRARVLIDIYTGKRVYKNMLIKSITNRTTKESENALVLEISCRQIILVSTSVVTVPINKDAQADPKKTSPTTDMGSRSVKQTTKYKEVPL